MDDKKQDKGKVKIKRDNKNSLLLKVKTFFTNISAEFKKIIWPAKDVLVKQTVVVIVICAIIGAIIFGMDTGLASVLKFVAGFI